MKTKLKLMVAGLVLSAGMAMAAVNTEQVIADLQAEGYTWIEVKRGPTQIKIEAVKGTTKVETVIDAATGAVLKTETETASLRDQERTGVQVRDRNEDFVDVSEPGDDDSNDDDSNDDNDDSSDDSNDDSDDSSDDGNDDSDDSSDDGNDDDDDSSDDGDDDHGGDDDSNDDGDDDHGGDDDNSDSNDD